MPRTILVTGATDGIGLETAKMLVAQGHHVLIHGRNPEKLATTQKVLSEVPGGEAVENYCADLSNLAEVKALAQAIAEKHDLLDVVINNAGIFKTPEPITKNGMDVRFVVNTFAPALLTERLMPLLTNESRVVNLSSAAQAPVNLEALTGRTRLYDDFDAYAQSKLAMTMWSRQMGLTLNESGPIFIAVNPGSLLASKMVKEAFGQVRGGVEIGAEILTRAALDEEFATETGQYFDNDAGQFSPPHPDALEAGKCEAVVKAIEEIVGA